ncbi:MAG: glycosyltransferase family 4 protein [Bryobacteraceae bacterium]
MPGKRILYVAPCWPDEKTFGTQLRVENIARALKHVGEVRVVVVRFDDDGERAHHAVGSDSEVVDFVELKVAPARSFASTLQCGLDANYISVHGQVIDPAARDRVIALSKEFDLIWLHHLFVANAFGVGRWNNSVMDIDDVPSLRERSIARNGESLRQRGRATLRMVSAKRREARFPERFDVLSVCSERDRGYLNLNMPVHVIPNGFQVPKTESTRLPFDPPRIGFVGGFNYPPNVEGVRWFLDQCWNRIRTRIPRARFRLVGRGTEAVAFTGDADVDALGWLSDTAEEIASWSAMIVPIREGSGTRVKIAEGFARKCPIVSTSLGAYGYDLESGRELLLADSAEAFAAACVQLIEDPLAASAMSDRGYRMFLENFSWEAISPRVWATAEDCLRRTHNG